MGDWIATVNEALVAEPSAGWEQDRQIRSFEDLRVWQYCRDLRRDIALLARALPPLDKGYLTNKQFQHHRNQCMNAIRLLNGYIRYLQQQTRTTK